MTADKQMVEHVRRAVVTYAGTLPKSSWAHHLLYTYSKQVTEVAIAAYEEALKEEGYEIIDRRTKPDKASRPQRR